MASILLIVAVAIPAIFLLLLWRYSYWYRQGVPQGNPLKLFGDFNDITITWTPHFDHYVALTRKYTGKPFYGVYSLTAPRLILRDPDIIKQVFTKKFSSFANNGFELDVHREPLLGRDPFFTTGEKWKESRANFTSMFTPGRLRSMLLQTDIVAKEAIAYLKNMNHESGKGDGADVKNFAVRFMTDLLLRATLSVEAGSFKEDQNIFMETGKSLFQDFISLSTGLVMTFAPKLGPALGFSILRKSSSVFFGNIVTEQKAIREKAGITRDDILDMISKRTEKAMKSDADGQKTLTKAEADLEVIAMVVLFYLEGFETTSTTTSAAIVELARNTELQENLRSQVLAICPPGKDISEEALNSVPLLQHCFLEALRMYPPALFIQRVATEDVTLHAKTGEQISLKKGNPLNISLGGYHRDPEFFPEPDTYDPDRFENETQKRHFFGFGDGPRACPGQKLAQLAGRVLLASILREFRLELGPKTRYPLKSVKNPFIFVLEDVWVRFVPL